MHCYGVLWSCSGVLQSCSGVAPKNMHWSRAMFQHFCVTQKKHHYYNKRLLEINRINIFILYAKPLAVILLKIEWWRPPPSTPHILNSQIYWKYSLPVWWHHNVVLVVGAQMCVGMVHTTTPHSSR